MLSREDSPLCRSKSVCNPSKRSSWRILITLALLLRHRPQQIVKWTMIWCGWRTHRPVTRSSCPARMTVGTKVQPNLERKVSQLPEESLCCTQRAQVRVCLMLSVVLASVSVAKVPVASHCPKLTISSKLTSWEVSQDAVRTLEWL